MRAGGALVIVWVAFLALWIWALIDCIRVPDDRYFKSGTKVIWVVVIVLLGIIGAIIYLLAGRPDQAARASAKAGGDGAEPPLPPPVPRGSLPPPPV